MKKLSLAILSVLMLSGLGVSVLANTNDHEINVDSYSQGGVVIRTGHAGTEIDGNRTRFWSETHTNTIVNNHRALGTVNGTTVNSTWTSAGRVSVSAWHTGPSVAHRTVSFDWN